MLKKNKERCYCGYYNVGYFVFVESPKTGVREPIIEVDNKKSGNRLIIWLKKNQFVIEQITNVANDNF